MEETIQKVFNKKWKPLQNNYKDIEDYQSPSDNKKYQTFCGT